MRLCEIRRRHLKALIIDKKRKGYARDTVRLTRAAISTVLTDAVDDELIPANPALRLLAKTRGKEALPGISQVLQNQMVRPA